jgi:hypothetical protein
MMVNQLKLFAAPTLNVLRDVKVAMATAARDCGMSRDELCDRMNALADRYGVCLAGGRGQKLTLPTLDKWLNTEDKEHFPSIKALPVFCAVTNDIGPMRAMIEPLGWQVIGDQDARLLAWARHYHVAKNHREQMRKIEAEL